MRSSENIEKLIENLDLDFDTNPETDQTVLDELREAQERSRKMRPSVRWPDAGRFIMKNPMTKLAAAAAVFIVVLIGVYPFGNSKTSIVWADVAEHFESVPFFHLTMYIGNDASAEIKKIQIWKSEDSLVRAQEGNTVMFADFSKKESEILIFDRDTKEMKQDIRYDSSSKEPVISNGAAPMFLTLLCKNGRFSLDTLTASLPPQVKGITSVDAADTPASRETVLFEARHETTPEYGTIWALRQSKLPIRLRFCDPRKSEYGDFFFDYSEEKDAAFFDPDAFANQ